MIRGGIAAIDGKPESSRTYVEQSGGIGQVHPRSLWRLVSLRARNAMLAAQCGDSLSGSASPASRNTTIAVQNASDEVIAANASQDPNGFY